MQGLKKEKSNIRLFRTLREPCLIPFKLLPTEHCLVQTKNYYKTSTINLEVFRCLFFLCCYSFCLFLTHWTGLFCSGDDTGQLLPSPQEQHYFKTSLKLVNWLWIKPTKLPKIVIFSGIMVNNIINNNNNNNNQNNNNNNNNNNNQ